MHLDVQNALKPRFLGRKTMFSSKENAVSCTGKQSYLSNVEIAIFFIRGWWKNEESFLPV